MLLQRFTLLAPCGKLTTSGCRWLSRYSMYQQTYQQMRLWLLPKPACIMHKRAAGHSHWQNIRHIKAEKDAEKQAVTIKMANMIRLALRLHASSDPKVNSHLAKAIKLAEQNNIPSKNIQSIVDKAVASKNSTPLTKVEMQGPSGSYVVFELATDFQKKTVRDINKIINTYGGKMLSTGSTTASFVKKGIITASVREGKSLELAEAEDIAITVDAEDVKSLDGNDTFELTCEPDSLFPVIKRLSETDLEVEDYIMQHVPFETIILTDNEKEDIERVVDAVKMLADCSVENIYDNIQW